MLKLSPRQSTNIQGVAQLATDRPGHYLKYALFCRETEEGPGDDLTFKGVVDL